MCVHAVHKLYSRAFIMGAIFFGGRERVWREALKHSPIRKRGIERKKPPMAQVLVNDAFFRYLVVLEMKRCQLMNTLIQGLA